MGSRASIPSFGLALALSLPLSCCTTGLALASEGDLSPVTDRLDTITSYEVSEESLMHDVGVDVAEVKQDVDDLADLQLQEVQEVQGLRQMLTDSAMTLEEHEGLRKLNSIEQTLVEIKEAVAPEQTEGETEGEDETEGEGETEGETSQTVEPATLDDVARLLMINTATLAILLGVEIWRPLYDVLSGVW